MDVVRGNPTLFMRRDEVEAAWAWVEPILEGWQESGEPPKPYTAGSWGPSAAIALIERDGRTWHEDWGVTRARRRPGTRARSWERKPWPNAQAGLHDLLTTAPVVPVLMVETVEIALPLARALLAGGLPVLEITLRTPAALEVIRALAGELEGAIVGAGTVLTPAQYRDGRARRRALRGQPRRDAGPARGGGRERGAVPARRGDRERGHAPVRAGLSLPQVLPRRARGRRRLSQGARLAVAGGALLPDRGYRRCARAELSQSAQRALRRRLLGRARRAVAAGDWPRITGLARAAAALARPGRSRENARVGSDQLCRLAGARAPRRGDGRGPSARPVRRRPRPVRELLAAPGRPAARLLQEPASPARRCGCSSISPARPISRAGARACSRASKINITEQRAVLHISAPQPLQPADPGRRRGRDAGRQRRARAHARLQRAGAQRRLAGPHRRRPSPMSSTSASAAPTSAR